LAQQAAMANDKVDDQDKNSSTESDQQKTNKRNLN
jgi:hypothetical protein